MGGRGLAVSLLKLLVRCAVTAAFEVAVAASSGSSDSHIVARPGSILSTHREILRPTQNIDTDLMKSY